MIKLVKKLNSLYAVKRIQRTPNQTFIVHHVIKQHTLELESAFTVILPHFCAFRFFTSLFSYPKTLEVLSSKEYMYCNYCQAVLSPQFSGSKCPFCGVDALTSKTIWNYAFVLLFSTKKKRSQMSLIFYTAEFPKNFHRLSA